MRDLIQTGRARWAGDRSLHAALAAVMAFGGLFIFLGDLGKWREDWVWTAHDPVSGQGRWAEVVRFPFFWRPCSLVYVRAINTAFWDHDWVRQALGVAAYLAAAWLLYRVLWRLGVGAWAATAGALMLMLLPQGYEVVFWPSATPTAIAVGLYLFVCSRVIHYARGRRGAGALALIAAAAFITPCWNEQPAAGFAALPLLVWAVMPRGLDWRRAIGLAAAPTAAACGACAAYVGLYLATGARGARGAIGSYVSLAELPERVMRTFWSAAGLGLGRGAGEMVVGGIKAAVPVLRTPPGIAWVVAAIVLVAAFAWRAGGRREESPAGTAERPRTGLLVLFGLGAAALMFGPMIAIRGIAVEPRMIYPPGACLIVSFAAAGAVVGERRRGSLRAIASRLTAAAIGVLLLACSASLIGYQAMLRERSRMDWAEGRALRAACSDALKDSLFIPARVLSTAAGTGEREFDRAEFGAWSKDAYGTSVLRQVYGRRDVSSKRLWPGAPGMNFGPEGVRATVWVAPGFTQGLFETRRFAWDHVVPFEVGRDGAVRLYHAVWVQHPGGTAQRFEVLLPPGASGTPSAGELRISASGG